MITQDIELAQKMFTLISDGIVNGYDSFSFTAEVYSNYIESELLVSIDGEEISNAEIDFNRAILYKLMKKLKQGFADRGENWESFTIAHTQGGQVKTTFKYPENQ